MLLLVQHDSIRVKRPKHLGSHTWTFVGSDEGGEELNLGEIVDVYVFVFDVPGMLAAFVPRQKG